MSRNPGEYLLVLWLVALGALGMSCGNTAAGPGDHVIPCTSEQDCPVGQVCLEGICQIFGGDPLRIPCSSGADCPDGWVCVDNFCELATDGGTDGGEELPEPDIEILDPPMVGDPPAYLLDFGSVAVGHVVTQTVRLRNAGTADLHVLDLAFEFGTSRDFFLDQITIDRLPLVIAPGQETGFEIQYQATDGLTDSGILDVISNDPDEARVLIQLLSEFKGKADILVSPMELRFGDIPVGQTGQLQLSISNNGTGNAVLTLAGIQLYSLASDTYELRGLPGFPAYINRGEKVVADVVFHPQAVGWYSDRVVIASNDEDAPQLEVPLSGRGVWPDLKVEPAPVDLGEVRVGKIQTADVTISNQGGAPLAVTGLALSSTSNEYALSSDAVTGFDLVNLSPAQPKILQPAEGRVVTIHYAPIDSGMDQAILLVDSPDIVPTPREVAVTGLGYYPPNIQVNPLQLDFGDLHIRGRLVLPLSVTNLGERFLEVSTIRITGGLNSFSFLPSSLPYLGKDDQTTLEVTFAPLTIGGREATLELGSNDPDYPLTSVPLTGNGIDPNIFTLPMPPIDFGKIYRGQSSRVVVYISNVGVGSLIIQSIAMSDGSSADFSLINVPVLPTVLENSGVILTFEIRYAPQAIGADTGAVRIESSDLDTPERSLALLGEGVGCSAGQWDIDGDPANGCEYLCNLTNSGVEACDTIDNDCDAQTDENFDLNTDVRNCGICNQVCSYPHATPRCTGGTCGMESCQANYWDINHSDLDGCEYSCTLTGGGTEACDHLDNDCDGQTDEDTDLSIDPKNCGSCNNVCALSHATPECVGGSCAILLCDQGFADCDHQAPNGCEVNLITDPANCNACGVVCSFPNATALCVSGSCGMGNCNDGFGDCDLAPANGCESNLKNDESHCGACTTACSTGELCQAGHCECGNTGDSCPLGLTCCVGACVSLETSSSNCGSCGNACNANAYCQGGTCHCTAPYLNCNGNWGDGCEVNTGNSASNCGSCGNSCGSNATCSSSVCQCTAPYANCNGLWTDGCEMNTSNNAMNCGSCGNSCGANATCSGSACQCTPPYANCNATWADGCEVNTSSSALNCGACGNSCGSNATCSSSACQCTTPYANCNGLWTDGCEVNTSSNALNCGACGNSCGSNATCSSSTCQCIAPYADCNGLWTDGCEVNTSSNAMNCGACGNSCGSNATCSSSACQCTSPYMNCNGLWTDGCEINTGNSASNCGSCGNSCGSNATCSSSACQCTAPYANCNGLWTDGCEINTGNSASNCGSCGNSCGSNASCSGSICQCTPPYANCNATWTDGCEVNTSNSASNCGSCGNSCGSNATCSSSACQCTAPYANCDGSWANGCEVNTSNSSAHCGSCNNSCGANATCASSACQCTAPYANCDDNWANGCETNLNNNSANCGSCGNSCNANAYCSSGTCQCNTGYGNCNTNWSDGCETQLNSLTNCGACTVTCSRANATATCATGTCQIASCNFGWGDCDANDANGCETSLTTLTNCGNCGTACSRTNATATCSTGICQILSCNPGYGNCDGNDANGCELQLNNLANCEGCGVACSRVNATATCTTGTCLIQSCNAGWGNCDAVDSNGCENSLDSLTDCGSCGTSCSRTNATATCAGDVCHIASCNTGWGNCDGVDSNGCENTLDSLTNCGYCGTACSRANATATCAGDVCQIASCNAGWGNCDAVDSNGCEVNLSNTTAHCGACYNNCGQNAYCSASSCQCNSGWGNCNTNWADGCETQLNSLANCGNCGVACSRTNATATCSSGSCEIQSCNAGWGNCDAVDSNGCENSLDSLTNCGSCGTACSRANATASCVGDVCHIASCNSGWGNCDAVDSNGCENSLDSLTSCGSCGTACSRANATASCVGDICQIASCNSGWGNCDAVDSNGCENSLDSLTNCGSCGTACSRANATASCVGDVCHIASCNSGWGNCDAVDSNGCENSLDSLTNCGSCGTACSRANATASCVGDVCQIASCNSGWGNCDAVDSNGCENSLDSLTTCGSCGTACSRANATASCSGDVCHIASCNSGWGNCDAVDSNGCEVNTTNNPNHCGSCGNSCGSNATCSSSACQCTAPYANCNGLWTDGCEINITNNVSHCGACNAACNLAHVLSYACSSSTCQIVSCMSGYHNLNGLHPDGCECQDVGSEIDGNTCATAINLGSIYDSGASNRSNSAGGNLSEVGDVDWYTLTAVDNPDTTSCGTGKVGETFDLNIAITPAADEFEVTVYRGGCPPDGTAVCANDTAGYRLDASGEFTSPSVDPPSGGCPCLATNTSGYRICAAFQNTYYIAVARVSAPPIGNTCTIYTLSVTNGAGH